jgi:hypothetical protein
MNAARTGGAAVIGAGVSIVTVEDLPRTQGRTITGVGTRTRITIIAFTQGEFMRTIPFFWITDVDGAGIPIVADMNTTHTTGVIE